MLQEVLLEGLRCSVRIFANVSLQKVKHMLITLMPISFLRTMSVLEGSRVKLVQTEKISPDPGTCQLTPVSN